MSALRALRELLGPLRISPPHWSETSTPQLRAVVTVSPRDNGRWDLAVLVRPNLASISAESLRALTVALVGEDAAPLESISSDRVGQYRFLDVAPGEYRLRVTDESQRWLDVLARELNESLSARLTRRPSREAVVSLASAPEGRTCDGSLTWRLTTVRGARTLSIETTSEALVDRELRVRCGEWQRSVRFNRVGGKLQCVVWGVPDAVPLVEIVGDSEEERDG